MDISFAPDCKSLGNTGQHSRQVSIVLRRLPTGTIAAGRRLPDPYAAQATRFGFRDLDQRFLGNRVDGMVVNVESEDESHSSGLLVKQRVGLMHGHHPVAGDALMRTVTVAGLVTGLGSQSPPISSSFVGL